MREHFRLDQMPTYAPPIQKEIQRSLAAIVITDAVGFSQRMSQDEDAALSSINRDLQLISILCHQFKGRTLKTTGDGALMYFVSAVQAVSCSIEIQKRFSVASEQALTDQHFVHRIGIHLGDIFFNNGDIMGSAVNITARLEAEAKPGSICMSQVVYEVVKSRLSLEASYAGELSLKNIAEYVSAYHVAIEKPKVIEKPAIANELAVPFIVPLNNALKRLSVHEKAHTIKELLLTAQKGSGENSETLLEGTSLKLLLEAFTEGNSTLSECQTSLYQAANVPGRAEEYFAAADVIIENLQDFYGEYEDSPQIDIFGASGSELGMVNASISDTVVSGTRIVGAEEISAEDDSPVQGLKKRSSVENSVVTVAPPIVKSESAGALHSALANRLEQSGNRIEIKKLLYCACCQQWEDSCDRIEAISMLSMVQELYKQANNFKTLKLRLESTLKNHNIEEDFGPISYQIVTECSVLYDEKNSAD